MLSPIGLLILTISITSYEAAKILAFFPCPSFSHQVVFRPLTQELAQRGHEVTVITPNPAFPSGAAPANLTEIDVHDLSYERWKSMYKLASPSESGIIAQLRLPLLMLVELVEMQLNVDAVQKVLKEEKFDLLILEAFVKPALVLSHIVKAPVIQVSSFGNMNYNVRSIGSAWHPLLYPDSVSKRLYNRTKREKLTELWNFFKLENMMQEVEDAENKLTNKMFGPDAPTMNDLKNNVDMLFLNTYSFWEGNRPVPPSVVFMGGIHKMPENELPTDLKTYLDSSKNGVIYLSFGSNVQPSHLPPDKIELMIKVFSQLAYDVLWKWDMDELPGRSENIKISKWMPQSDLLRHPNVKAFITQCGLQSTDEAIAAGVPLIGIPMFGDQSYNVEKYVYHNIGVHTDLMTMTEELFKNAINNVISDDSYRQNIRKLRSMMHDQPQPPLERAVWWTEHVLRHGGGKHLRSPAANMSWAQYLELELVLTLFAIALGFVLVLFLIVLNVWKYFSRSLKQKKIKKMKKNITIVLNKPGTLKKK